MEELIRQCNEFSYKKSVESSSKKLIINCNNDVEDLFQRIFTPSGQERTTFSRIRSHPVFKKHFKDASNLSKAIYENAQFSVIECFPSRNYLKKKMFEEEAFVEETCARFDLLMELSEEIFKHKELFDEKLTLRFEFLVLKVNVALMEELLENYLNEDALRVKRPDLSWDMYCLDQQFLHRVKEYKRIIRKQQQALTAITKFIKRNSVHEELDPFIQECLE